MNNLKILREERKLSMRGMEIKTGIKYNTYSRYESGERDLNTEVLKKLAAFFEVSTDYLLDYNGFCLYLTYEANNVVYRIEDKDYKQLQEYIYFNKEEKRCIDLNKYIGINKDSNIGDLLKEINTRNKLDKLFDKGHISNKLFESIIADSERVIITVELLDYMKALLKGA